MTIKSLLITIWGKSHAHHMPVGSGRTEYSEMRSCRAAGWMGTHHRSMTFSRSRWHYSGAGGGFQTFLTMTHWTKLILHNDSVHKYVKQNFHSQNLVQSKFCSAHDVYWYFIFLFHSISLFYAISLKNVICTPIHQFQDLAMDCTT